MFEEGQQIRRSIKSGKATIVEGYGRRRYKQEFIKFLVYSPASNDETIDHHETLFETDSLRDENIFKSIYSKLDLLVRKINNFIKAVEEGHLGSK